MRSKMTALVAIVAVSVIGCVPVDLSGLLGELQGLGGIVCTAYDFDSDGTVTTAELQEGLEEVFGSDLGFTEAELQEALEFYSCNQ